MGATNATEAAILDHIVSNATYTPPSSFWVALSTTTPTATGTNFTEPGGGSYARVEIDAADWAAASGGAPSSVATSSLVQFPEATGSWGSITHVGLYSLSSGGTLSYWGALTTPRSVTTGQQPQFAIGDLVLQVGAPSEF